MWGGMGESWKKYSSSLASSRSSFSVLVIPDQVCSAGPLPPPSCPTVDGGTCVFPFINGDLRLDIGHFSLSNLNPSGSKSYSSCISRDDETFWCLPSTNDWVQCQVDKCPLQSTNSEGTLSMILHIFSCALRWKTLSDHKI